ncbi:MAG: metallophosphoesterase [Clostridia bacterium]|nr:metallophosphoesterase [Clostridia bacterium]
MMKDIFCLHGTAPEVEKSVLKFEGIPADLVGKKLLFATDAHFGGLMNDRRMGRIIDLMTSLKPDIILLGGDNADNFANEAAFCERHLSRLHAPMGVFCVPGNNDWEAVDGDYDKLRHMVKKAGATLLVNEYVTLPVDAGRLIISGIDDYKRGNPDKNSISHFRECEDFHILLSHSPSAIDDALEGENSGVRLVLCGHTHGGQLRIGKLSPYAIGFENTLNSRRKYFFVNGEHDVDGMKIIVSNGIGCSLLPVRIGVAPQINLFTLSGG